jgi:hypothetical protein
MVFTDVFSSYVWNSSSAPTWDVTYVPDDAPVSNEITDSDIELLRQMCIVW